jgi:signal recognition particle receptor subunit beta
MNCEKYLWKYQRKIKTTEGSSSYPMAFINFSSGEIQCKIIYYGPGLGGKTTNLRYIHDHTNDNIRGQLVSIDTKGDRTLFFDFLSLDLGKIRDYKIRVQLYTVPGQVHYDATRKLVLRGADGIVFVADSMRVQREKNVESLENMAINLKEKSIDINKMPLVIQYNKRDLDGSNIPVLTIEELERDLNAHLKAPFFTASALKGDGVYETLREISKLAVRDVSRKVLAKGQL